MKVLGLMSGTSVDGVDVALVDILGKGHDLRVHLVRLYSLSYPSSIRHRILSLSEKGTVADVCHLDVLLGEFFARAALKAIAHSSLSPGRVKLIGSHGQTIYHRPRAVREPGFGLIRSTFQIGDPAVIAERTGITTVADVRARDLAAGGEGAPLAPYAHYLVFRHQALTRCVVNLGGIANVTFLPAGGQMRFVQAFDTGPCNMLLDGLASVLSNGKQAMDRGGRIAKRGRVDLALFNFLMGHPFLKRKPPKSTGREEFGMFFVKQVLKRARRRHLSDQDLLATCCRFIASSISHAQKWCNTNIDEVVVGGGGVYNHALMTELVTAFDHVPVMSMEACGSHSKAFEAQAFAILAYQTYHGICANLPSVTGARHPVVLGSITPGKGMMKS